MPLSQNPYATPKTISHDIESGEYGELKYLTTNGRIGRMRLLAWNFGISLILFTAAAAIILLMGTLSNFNPDAGLKLAAKIGFSIYIYMILMNIIFVTKRLHDVNRSGWLLLLILVPLVNIFLGIYLLCAAGSPSSNNYGAPPPPNTTGIKVLFWTFIAIIILIIFAVITLM